jgi:hypothetical protein
MDVRELHDLTVAYALDALDADEAEARAHLARCERCRVELAALTETAGARLGGRRARRRPRCARDPRRCGGRERTNVVPLPGRPPGSSRATAAAAAVAARSDRARHLGRAAVAPLHHERSARQRPRRPAAILADPASRRIVITGGSGLVAVNPDGDGVLVVRKLPAAPAGKTYEAWVIPPGGAPKPAGLSRGGTAATTGRRGDPGPRGAVVAATIERAGGAVAPTGTPIFSARS